MSAPAPTVPPAATSRRVLHFRDVAKAFPDGTVALERGRPRHPPRRVRHRGRPVRLRQVHAAADRLRALPGRPPARSSRPRRGSATCSRTPRCCPGARCGRTSSCWPSCTGCRSADGSRPRADGDRPGRAHRLREALPRALSGGMRMRCLAGPVADPRPGRCSCSTSRSARSTRSPASASTTSCSRLFLAEGFAGAVHHPLGQRGGLPVDPGAGDVGPARPDRGRRSTSRSRTHAHPGPALHRRVRRAGRRGLARAAGGSLVSALDTARGEPP